jgi:protein-tyrosine phosphatase
MLKKAIFSGFLLLLVLGSVSSVALASADAPLVFDAFNQCVLPKNFRATQDVRHLSKSSARQLGALHAFGSAQFSEAQLQMALKKTLLPVVIIDLRQESHGFVNGNAVSWYGIHNWANAHKTAEDIEAEQEKKLNALINAKKIIIHVFKKLPDGTALSPICVDVHEALSEAELVRKYHLQYFRLYIADGQKPDDQQVDRFIQFVKSLPKNTVIYFHCRAGRGRTTMLMAMYDMMRNAKQASFKEIMRRQFLIGGKDLLQLPEKQSYKYPFAVNRKLFLERFYRYCCEQSGD